MYKARIKNTNKIIEAEDLKVLENVRQMEFVCVDENCGITLIPRSYGEQNKKRPHFKKKNKQEHSKNCSYGSFLHLLDIGKKRKLTDIEFEKLEYPSQLVINVPKSKETDTTTKDNLPTEEGTTTRRISNGEFEEATNSNRKVTSINQIVDFYLNCPFNRDAELDLLGKSAPYMYQFRRISGKNEGDYIDGKIFYGVINLNDGDSVISKDGKTRIKLLECEFWKENKRSLNNSKTPINPYWIEIDTNEISKYKLTRILRDRETVANQSKNDFKNAVKKKDVNAFVFFIGNVPEESNNYTFKVVNGFVSFRYTNIRKTITE